MKEHPILFCTPMVQAIRAGIKSQTRRIGKRHDPWQPGDLLWVRETFFVQPELWGAGHGPQSIHYAADITPSEVEGYMKKPSIFMPRWASRISLRLTAKRMERLSKISLDDVRAEGFRTLLDFFFTWVQLHPSGCLDSDSSPGVYVLSFEVIP